VNELTMPLLVTVLTVALASLVGRWAADPI
jgi:hypothetical protein